MKNYNTIHILLYCYMLLHFTIGIEADAVAESEAPPVKELPSYAASEEPPLYKTIESAKTYIAQHQNRDGGWPPGARWR